MAATTAAARGRSRVHAGALPIGHTVGLAAVLVVATLYGLLDPEAYRVSAGVRDTLPETLRGQDLLTLLTVPFVFAAHGQLNVGEVGMWATVTAVASGWLVAGARSVRPVTTPWLRPTLWPVSASRPSAPGGAAVRPPPTGPGGPARPVGVRSSWARRT